MRSISRRIPHVIVTVLLAVTCVVTTGADELRRVGKDTAIVFSPDFADPENRLFYEGLGFLYIESADWREVLRQIREHNSDWNRQPVRVLVVESHGTNGNGLKLQDSKAPEASRSYISVGALQEKLEGTGVDWVVLSACNAGRLFRPEIYSRLDRDVDDALFLPATLGVVDASEGFEKDRSSVRVLRRAQSNLESLMHGTTAELPSDVRTRLHGGGQSWRFAVSTMLIQMLTGDDSLELVTEGFVREKSRADLSVERSEALFQQFIRHLVKIEANPGNSDREPAVLLAVR